MESILKGDIKNANVTESNEAHSLSTYVTFSEKLTFLTPWCPDIPSQKYLIVQ